MERTLFALVLAFALIFPSLSAAGDTVTAKDIDERLAQNVTYDSGCRRLHSAIGDLKGKTGVAIYCGANSNDWRVTDIPIILIARDIRLGTLFDVIAVCTHTRLSSSTVKNAAGANVRTYRLFRDSRTIRQITAPLNAEAQALYDDADWAWDTLAKIGQAAEDSTGKLPRKTVILSKIIATMDADAKDRVFSGEAVYLRTRESRHGVLLRELYKIAWQEVGSQHGNKEDADEEPPQGLIDGSVLCFRMVGALERGLLELNAEMSPVPWSDGMGSGWEADLVGQASRAEGAKCVDLPPRPGRDKPGPPTPESPGVKWEAIRRSTSPILDQGVKLDLQKIGAHPTYADVARELAGQCGYSIICEDFASHQTPEVQVKAQATVREMLQGISSCNWYVNEKDKVMLGWANDWRGHHVNLVPESLLTRLNDGLNADGLEIDDVAAVTALSHGQLGEWVFNKPDTMSLALGLISCSMPFWQFYNDLRQEDKARARGEQGLVLGTLDQVWVADSFRKHWEDRMMKSTGSPEYDEQQKAIIAPMLDPKAASTMVLRVRREPLQGQVSGQKPALARHRYFMELQGLKEGKSFTTRIDGPMVAFPVYSAKREAELIAAAKGKAK